MRTKPHAAGDPGPGSEATLFQQARAGCSTSLNALMERHDGLVQAVVRQQVLGDLPFAEALQAGRIGLWRAILGFDPSRGLSFSTYAWPCIMHRVWRAVEAHTHFHSPLVSDARPAPCETPDPAVVWEAAAVRQALHDLVQCMSQRLRYVVVARYGLDGNPSVVYRQIGVTLGLSGERVRQLHTEALVWLRHPAHSYLLRSLLGRYTLADYEGTDRLAVPPGMLSLTSTSSCAWWTSALCAPCWPNFWAGRPPGSGRLSTPSPSSCSPAGRSPTAGMGTGSHLS